MRARMEFSSYELPLRIPMRTSGGSTEVRRGLLIQVFGESGLVGIGETAPLDGRELEQAVGVFERAAISHETEVVEPDHGARPVRIAQTVEQWLGRSAPPSARCGLETALLDLLARRQGKSVTELLGGSTGASVEVNALVTEQDPRAAGERAADFFDRGFRTLKLKVGNPETDLARIRNVLAAADPARSSAASPRGATPRAPFTLRLDANRGWEFSTAASLLAELEGMPIDYVEEPLRDPAPHVLARLRRISVVGIALDESISTPAEFDRFAGASACDVLVLKLQRLGGVSAAMQLAASARGQGIRVVLTDSLETAVGRAATLHCAAACTTEAVGLAGAFLMSDDGSGHDRPRVDLAGAGLGVTAS